LKKIKINKISRTGKNYKLIVDEFLGFWQLVQTSPSDPDALAIIRKGVDAVYCPICFEPECIKQATLMPLKYAHDINLDLERSMYREIHMCFTNADPIRNMETIHKILESHNKEATANLLENQSHHFYLVENFAYAIINPDLSKNILCPSCGAHKFHRTVLSIIKKGLPKCIECPDCSMGFYVHNSFSPKMLILNQLYRNFGIIYVDAFGKEIRHIFTVYPFSVPVKVRDGRIHIFNYPTDYIRLTSPIQIEEFCSLLPHFNERSTIIKRGHIKNDSSDKESHDNRGLLHGVRAFYLSYLENIDDLIELVAKGERDKVMLISVYGERFGEINIWMPDSDDIVCLPVKPLESWSIYYMALMCCLGIRNKLAKKEKMPTGAFVLLSPSYPSEVTNFPDWREKSEWAEIPRNEIVISPYDVALR